MRSLRTTTSLSLVRNFSYTKALVSPDRLSQVNNPELLKVYPNTGLQYRDTIIASFIWCIALCSISSATPSLTPSHSSHTLYPYHCSIFCHHYRTITNSVIDETSILPNESTRSALTLGLSRSFDANMLPQASCHILLTNRFSDVFHWICIIHRVPINICSSHKLLTHFLHRNRLLCSHSRNYLSWSFWVFITYNSSGLIRRATSSIQSIHHTHTSDSGIKLWHHSFNTA